MHILPFRATYPNLSRISSIDVFFDSVREEYNQLLANGFYQQLAETGVYVYEIAASQRSYIGLIAGVDLQDFLEGCIKKHEQTLPEKEQLQLQLLLEHKAEIKPVLLSYRRVDQIDHWLDQQRKACPPFLEIFFPAEQRTHRLWQVRETADIQTIQGLFARLVPCTYIADGHHRVAVAAILQQHMARQPEDLRYRRLLCALFGSEQLQILEFNRVIDGLRDLSPAHFLAQVERYCNIKVLKDPELPGRKHDLILFFNGEWYRLRWRKGVLDEYENREEVLDIVLLNEKVLHEILGIEDMRNDPRIQYVEGALGLEGLRQKTLQHPGSIGFCLYPVQLDDMIRVVDAGQVLPPKSTWFEPRMKNGLIVDTFSDLDY